MQCSEMELVFEQEGLAPLSPEARQHLAQCAACKHFVQDVTTILAVAHELPAEAEPPERIWISIRAQLEQEGAFRQVSKPDVAAHWWQSFGELFRNRALASASVAGMIIVVVALLFRTPEAPVLEAHDDPFSSTVSVLSQQEHDLANMQLAGTSSTSAVDTSLRENLQQVDEFIADCERHAKQEPS